MRGSGGVSGWSRFSRARRLQANVLWQQFVQDSESGLGGPLSREDKSAGRLAEGSCGCGVVEQFAASRFEYQFATATAGGVASLRINASFETKRRVAEQRETAGGVADRQGGKLGLHPDDPQIPLIGGVARIMRSPEAFRKVIDTYPSDSNGLLFCVGCFTEMGANVPEELRYFAERDKVHWVHFRNTTGTTEKFVETFADCGDTDMYQAAKALHESGYQGYLTPDHRLRVEGDSDWGHRYWAYGLGYNKAVIMSLRSELG